MADSTLYTNALAVYDFENNANDTKGSIHLTAAGTPSYSTTGEAQGTYWVGDMDGSDDRFSVASASFRFTGDYAVSFWVRSKYVAEGATSFLSCFNNATGDGWEINTDGSQHVRVRHSTTYSDTFATFSTATMSNDVRYHVVLSYSDSGNTVTAWVSTTSFGNILNGATAAMAANPGSSTATFYIGYLRSDDSYHYGYFDEVVLWNSTVTEDDAEAIFNARDGGTSWRETAATGRTTRNTRSFPHGVRRGMSRMMGG